MLDVVDQEETGSLEPYRTKASESLAEGEGMKEGTVGRKAQFNFTTRNAKRKQGYDERDRVTVEIKDEQERECVTEVRIEDIKDGTYNVSYYPTVEGTLTLYVKVNEEHIRGSPFTINVKPFHVKPVLCFGKEGSGDGMFKYPDGVAVNNRDEIIVTDGGNHRVQVFDNNGTFVRSFGEFSSPHGIAIDKDRNIFVADGNNHTVQIFSCEGRHLGSIGGPGSLDNQLLCPFGLSLDSDGNVIVADTGNQMIKVFNPDGKFVMKIGGESCFTFIPHCVQCEKYLFVSDHFENCIKVFNMEGYFQYKFGKKGGGDGEFNEPAYLSVTPSNHLLVCDLGNCRIQVFELNGEFIGKFGTKGSKLGEFEHPRSVAVLNNGQIVVCDGGLHRIQIFE